MTLRIELKELPEDVQRAIEAGEPVEIVRDGCAVAAVTAQSEKTWGAYLASRRAAPPLDVDDFERDIAEGLKALRPQPYAWE